MYAVLHESPASLGHDYTIIYGNTLWHVLVSSLPVCDVKPKVACFFNIIKFNL